jgi:L-alanine-DL-glutamate epimerase-like enolase superfamily enzyme
LIKINVPRLRAELVKMINSVEGDHENRGRAPRSPDSTVWCDGSTGKPPSACFVEVETDDGIVGIGETYAGVYVPELAAAIVNWFKPS